MMEVEMIFMDELYSITLYQNIFTNFILKMIQYECCKKIK